MFNTYLRISGFNSKILIRAGVCSLKCHVQHFNVLSPEEDKDYTSLIKILKKLSSELTDCSSLSNQLMVQYPYMVAPSYIICYYSRGGQLVSLVVGTLKMVQAVPIPQDCTIQQ